jgi:hypothetical protein
MQMRHERAVNIFLKHALPGMTLKAPVQPVRPLHKRCACGRAISGTKARCLACQQDMLRDLASQITTQELLDAVLRQSFPEAWEELQSALTPYLTFTPASV